MMLQERIRRNSLTIPVNWNIIYLVSAGWSSLEARRAHNPKAAGSNPVPAMQSRSRYIALCGVFLRKEALKKFNKKPIEILNSNQYDPDSNNKKGNQ